MHLSAGLQLGPYRIVAPVGAGGMGEVYRARDSRLDRDVAIKVLPARFAADPEWRRRFDREARAVSALSHPNICAVYDVGHHDGIDFLVMEYLDGETLASRLTRGQLPLDQALRHGIEIAGALAAAHRKGIVHRDLKPGNVMLTAAGARLLDFGLAKPLAPQGAAPVEATVSAPITAHGIIVGTFQYMAPEQIEGGDVDERSDIFAFGTVLYEMLTGRRAFDGKTVASVMAAILEREPAPVGTLLPLAPPALDDIVAGCLAKAPDDRWQTAHDVRLQLEALRKRGPDRAGQPPVRASSRGWIGWSLAAVALAAVAALAGWSIAPRAEPAPAARLSLLPPPAHSFTPNDFAISPDGRRVAFVAAGADGVSTLWTRSLESSHPAEIGGSEGAAWPFWSPDGRWVGFFARGHLWKVEHGGTGLQSICPTSGTANSGTWGRADIIVFADQVIGPLSRVQASGGTPVQVTALPADVPGEAHRFPQFLPDGRRFLYTTSWTNLARGGIYLASIDSGPGQVVSAEIRGRTFLAGGHLLYVDAGTLYAQPFDTRGGRLTGAPRALLRNEVVSDWRFGEVPLSASENGTLVYQPPNTSQLVWYDRRGAELGTVGLPGYSAPAISPDGRRVAVSYDSKGTGQRGTWIYDLERQIPIQFAADGIHTGHAWSGDGRWIAYTAQQELNRLFRRATDGSGREEVILESPGHLIMNAYSSDGGRLLLMDFTKGPTELRMYTLASGQSKVIDIGAEGVFSPDGNWIAYVNYSMGSVVLTRPEIGQRISVTGSGSQVRWRDSRELFYIGRDKKMMVVPLTYRNGTIEPGKPQALFQTRIIQPRLVLFQYDVTSDGQRFLINSLPREDAAAPLTVVFNWPQLGR